VWCKAGEGPSCDHSKCNCGLTDTRAAIARARGDK